MKNIKISFTKSQCNVRCRQTLAKYLKLSCYRHKLRYIEENEVYNVGLTQWTVGRKLFHSHKGKTYLLSLLKSIIRRQFPDRWRLMSN